MNNPDKYQKQENILTSETPPHTEEQQEKVENKELKEEKEETPQGSLQDLEELTGGGFNRLLGCGG